MQPMRQQLKWRSRAGALGLIMAAVVAAIISYSHQRQLALTHRQSGFQANLWPLSVDGLVIACGARMAIDRLLGYRRGVWPTIGFWYGFAVSLMANWFSVYHVSGQLGVWIDHAIAASPALNLLFAAEAVMARPRGESKQEWPQVNDGGQPTAMANPVATEPDDAEVFTPGALDEPTREWRPVPEREPSSRNGHGHGKRKDVERPNGGPKLLKAMDAAERWPGVSGAAELSKRAGVSRATARRALDFVRATQT